MTDELKSLEIRLAWLAGILDGEGSISLNYVRAEDSRGKWYTCARFTVRIANTDPAMLNEVMAIADILGVRYFCSTYRNNPRKNEQPCPGVVIVSKQHVKAFLRVLLPYLITKKARAELCLRAIFHRENTRSLGGRYREIAKDPDFVSFVDQMKFLNRRGRREPDPC